MGFEVLNLRKVDNDIHFDKKGIHFVPIKMWPFTICRPLNAFSQVELKG